MLFINYSRHPNLSDPMTPFGVSSHGILDGCFGFMTSAWVQSLITMMAHSVSPAVRFGVVFIGGLAFPFLSESLVVVWRSGTGVPPAVLNAVKLAIICCCCCRNCCCIKLIYSVNTRIWSDCAVSLAWASASCWFICSAAFCSWTIIASRTEFAW